MRKLFLFSLCLLLVGTFLPMGRVGASSNSAYFESYNHENSGLSQNSVTCLVEDSFGFLWVGTKDGLNRYDGSLFQTYSHNAEDETSLASNNISALAIDENNVLWVGTNGGGLHKYEINTNSFVRYIYDGQDANAGGHNNINALLPTNYGLMIATDGGLVCMNTKYNTFNRIEAVGNKKVNCLALCTQSSDILVGASDYLYVYNYFDGVISYTFGNEQYFNGSQISTLAVSSKAVFVGTDGAGIFAITPFEQELNSYATCVAGTKLENDYIRSMFYDENSSILWVASQNGLHKVNTLNNATTCYNNIIGDSNSLPSNNLLSVFASANGIVWAGSNSGGLCKLVIQKQIFTRFYSDLSDKNSLSGNEITAIAEDLYGKVWIATSGGIDAYDSNHKKVSHMDNNLLDTLGRVQAITACPAKLWIGGEKGLLTYDLNSGTLSEFVHPQLDNNNILSLYLDSEKTLWIGTDNGLYSYKSSDNSITHYFVEQISITTIYKDSMNTLWLGTPKGLYSLNTFDGSVILYENKLDDLTSISSNNVLCIYEFGGFLWVGTLSGLNRMNMYSHVFDRYDSNNGLPSNIIYALCSDGQYMWAATAGALVRFLPSADSFRAFVASDGTGISSYNEKIGLFAQSGKLYFGGDKLVCFDPQDLEAHQNLEPILIFLREFSLVSGQAEYQEPLLTADFFALKHGESSIIVRFFIVNFINPNNLNISYRMDGLESDWLELSPTSRTIRYNNLASGDYTLQIRLYGDSQVDIRGEANIKIHIDTPFYQTVWFYMALVVGLLLLVYTVSVVRTKIIVSQNQVLEAKVAEQTHSLQKQLEEHEILEEKMSQLYAQERHLYGELNKELGRRIEFNHALVHELKTPLMPIMATSEMLMQYSRDDIAKDALQNIYNSATNLNTRVDELLDLARGEVGTLKIRPQMINIGKILKEMATLTAPHAKNNDLEFSYQIEEDLPQIYADSGRIRQVVQNMLSNALKYTPEFGQIYTKAYSKEGRIYVEVENSSPVIKDEHKEMIFVPYYQREREKQSLSGLGIGLSLSRQFVRLHKGDMWVEEHNGNNLFIFYLPIDTKEG